MLDIPQELRDLIYDHTVQTHASFTFSYVLDRPHPSQWSSTSGEHSVTYRLSAYTPLLLVCKQITAEIKTCLETATSVAHTTIRSSFHGRNTTKHPSQSFLSLCASSRFVLGCGSKFAHTLLNKSLASLRPAIRSVVIFGAALVLGEIGNKEMWFSHTHWTPFTRDLLWLPALTEVAMTVRSDDWFCNGAPSQLLNILELGGVQKVRFLYEAANKDQDTCEFLGEAETTYLPNDHTLTEEELENLPDRFCIGREEFDQTNSFQGEWSNWPGFENGLHAATVFAITHNPLASLPQDAEARLAVSENWDDVEFKDDEMRVDGDDSDEEDNEEGSEEDT
ncbi:hypothetical protein EJ08DRAFT_648690 [Tothia fuscella]|uniref:Uncharacterized protein n=1 Tax=Tothia fuscella TaxID=1048955 RepID=A0A9P4NUW9_9PEZI|nr:hypothetical protein EJ08DRAFT_648690 [Tothia fuscella]